MDGSLDHFKAGEARRNARANKHNQRLEKDSAFARGHKLILNFPEPNARELEVIKQSIRTKTAAEQKKKMRLLLALVLVAFSSLALLLLL